MCQQDWLPSTCDFWVCAGLGESEFLFKHMWFIQTPTSSKVFLTTCFLKTQGDLLLKVNPGCSTALTLRISKAVFLEDTPKKKRGNRLCVRFWDNFKGFLASKKKFPVCGFFVSSERHCGFQLAWCCYYSHFTWPLFSFNRHKTRLSSYFHESRSAI